MTQKVTGWVGWVWFAAFTLITIGLFNVVGGLVAVFDEDKVLAWSGRQDGLVVLDVSTWGWLHLALGAGLTFVGFALFGAATWARIIAIVLLVLNLVSQFFWLPITPWWSITVIVLGVFTLWALTVHGEEVERAVR